MDFIRQNDNIKGTRDKLIRFVKAYIMGGAYSPYVLPFVTLQNGLPCGRPFCNIIHGADNRNRTDDLILTKDVLYLLSYISVAPTLTIIHGPVPSVNTFLNKFFSFVKTVISSDFSRLPNYTWTYPFCQHFPAYNFSFYKNCDFTANFPPVQSLN